MDYEEKYKEALERAKKLQKTCDSQAVIGWCEYILPELRESEDERIRKWIIGVLATYEHDKNLRDSALAWLEKQGEQKPITFNCAHIIDSALNDYCCKQYNALLKENGGVLSFARLQHLAMDIYGWCKEYLQSEQKPTWSEEDEHRVKDTIYFLDTAKKHYASTVELDACIDWLKSLKQRIGR